MSEPSSELRANGIEDATNHSKPENTKDQPKSLFERESLVKFCEFDHLTPDPEMKTITEEAYVANWRLWKFINECEKRFGINVWNRKSFQQGLIVNFIRYYEMSEDSWSGKEGPSIPIYKTFVIPRDFWGFNVSFDRQGNRIISSLQSNSENLDKYSEIGARLFMGSYSEEKDHRPYVIHFGNRIESNPPEEFYRKFFDAFKRFCPDSIKVEIVAKLPEPNEMKSSTIYIHNETGFRY